MARFSDFYRPGRIPYSFEVFPPKDEAGVASLIANLKELSVFQPAFVSVTYGAMGSTRDLTRDLALRVWKETGLTTAFHFTCVGADRSSVKDYVGKLKSEGLNLIVALRGDRVSPSSTGNPAGTTSRAGCVDSNRGANPDSPPDAPHRDEFKYANELVAYLKEIDGFSIAVAGYPEGHIEAPDKETDLKNLKRKVDAGADIVITQLFFDNADYYDFVRRARTIGIRCPIIPGIMPVVSLKQIEKITGLCGAALPQKLREELQRQQENPEKMRAVGVRHAIAQCRDLVKNGVPGIHFYTLNRADSTRRIIEAL